MEKDRLSEDRYLKAKISYYEGNPTMSDAEFDVLEQHLKNLGSKVIEQVGSKRKDFDFTHPTKMLSLAKIQTEATGTGTYYAEDQFKKWFDKQAQIVGKMGMLEASPKFDGNAINIIYQGRKLTNVLTRGDGLTGKDVTKRFTNHLPYNIGLVDLELSEDDVLEIRAEVVIDINLFNSKYAADFANARNYVAGVIGKDDYDEIKISELNLIPLHYLVNGKHVSKSHFRYNAFFEDWDTLFVFEDYEKIIKEHEEFRKTVRYQLDGVVISFPVQERETLGENDHDPEWALAVKFVPVETITEVEGIEWNISKRGELIPTLLLKPVFLDGSTVKRASGYNAGYVIDKKVYPGAIISIFKAGDIIPEIQKVITESLSDTENIFPEFCPSCGFNIEFNGVHLICPNPNCPGRIAKQLSGAIRVLDIKRIGEKTIEPFAACFKNMYELICWVYGDGDSKDIELFGIKHKSRSHEIFIQAFKNIKSLTYEQVIQMLGYDNVGKKLSVQLAREHSGLDYDYANLERALVAKLRSLEISDYIKEVAEGLESLGIKIDKPKKQKEMNLTNVGVCMTGSPKEFGFKTKAEFISQFPGAYEVSLSAPDCKFLITDSYDSTSNKMKTAERKGIEIKTYGDFQI